LSLTLILVGSEDKHLHDLLNETGLKVSSQELHALITRKQAQSPDVIVIDVRARGLPAELPVVRRTFPGAGIIAIASQLDPVAVLDAMRAGVNEFLADPITAADIRQALERVSSLRPGPIERKVFAFIGAKGGVGTTTIAANVAAALGKTKMSHVLVVDLHPAYGDAALFFGAEPRFSVLDALENTHRLDEAYLRGLVVKTKTGVDLLASSDRSVVGAVDAHRVRTLIEFVSRHYTHVVLDVPRSDSSALDALEAATTIVIVAEQELSTVRGAARMAATLRQRYGKEKVQVVVSRFDTGSPITEADVARVTGGGVSHTFPSDYRLAVEALNHGKPIVADGGSKLSDSLVAFTRRLGGDAEKKQRSVKSGGILGRLTGRG